jgi:intracellular sulfur oxidation DsrE/DsrF family protein
MVQLSMAFSMMGITGRSSEQLTPNLKPIAEMKKHGVEFFVCGQYLVGEKIDPKTLTPDVQLAADALLVLMQYQNKGYALMSF